VKGASPKRRILIVDDESGLVRLMKLILEKTDRYQVHGETDASVALETAIRFQPDLILLDLIMPGMDGSELAAKFRATQGLQRKPIIFVSATVSRHEGIAGRIAGFPAISKPLGTKELIELVDACCPASLRKKQEPEGAELHARKAPRREGRKSNPKKDEKLKALVMQISGCISGSIGTHAPIRETKLLNINENLRILSMTESWTYAPSKALHVKIDRSGPDLAMLVTVSVNQGEGKHFDESRTEELLAHIRGQVAHFTA
jgi:CheY-like chemotaxis protein